MATFVQAIPSFVSLYLQRWFYEGMVIMAGWLPDPHIPVGAMAVAMNVFSLVTMLPMAFNIAGATRVGNELGKRGQYEFHFSCAALERALYPPLMLDGDRTW